jgi:hypothetical protein
VTRKPRETLANLISLPRAFIDRNKKIPPGGVRSGGLPRVVALALAMALVVSAVAPFAFATTAAALPSGLVGVPDSNVSEDVPVGSTPRVRATELQGSVMASDHAETLEVVVTTPERARDYLAASGANVGGAGESGLSLVLQDDVHSQGRTVAIDAGAVREALGYTPEQVYGTHEDGTEWSSRVGYEGGLLVFEVPHFSSNVVEFSGTVELSATPASDGTTLTYDVSDYDAVSNLTVNVTGALASETDTETGIANHSDSTTLSIAGSADPVNATVSASPRNETVRNDTSSSATEGDLPVSIIFENAPHTLSAIAVDHHYYEGGGVQPSPVELNVFVPDGAGGWEWAYRDTDWASGDGNFGVTKTTDIPDVETNGTVKLRFDDYDGDNDIDLSNHYYTDLIGTNATTINVTPSDGSTAQIASGALLTNETYSDSVSLTKDTSSLTWDLGSTSASVDYTLEYTERQQTVDPAVEVNGHWTNYTGTLANGETVSLSANDSWVQEGTNRINVSLGSAGSDPPAPVVDLSYSHDALDEQTVSYEGEKWTERYNVSKTFASERSATSLTIPFVGNVYRIRDVEKRANGSSWSDVPTDEYDLSNTTLTVQTGAVDAGTTVEVRANGSRLAVNNASITVTEPTLKGERLDSEIVLDSWGSDSYLSVGGTPDGRRIHYAYEETWTADEHSTVLANGVNRLHLPNAATNDVFRVSTIPVRVNVASNEAKFSVETASTTEPTFHVEPGTTTGDDVAYTFADAQDETSYVLWSKTDEIARDSGTANSPLTLSDDDSEETLTFKLDDDRASSAADDGGAAGWWSEPASTASGVVPAMPIANPALIALLVLGVIGGAIYYTDRRPGFSSTSTPFYRRPIVLFATVLAFALAILLISPETVTHPLRVALEASLPIASILGVLIALGGVAYWLWTRRKARVKEAATPDTVLRLGGDDD